MMPRPCAAIRPGSLAPSPAFEIHVRLSPDGRRMAYASNEEGCFEL